jgi:hypothetical protein
VVSVCLVSFEALSGGFVFCDNYYPIDREGISTGERGQHERVKIE